MRYITFIGTREHGLHGNGKLLPAVFFNIFLKSMRCWGVICEIFENIDHFRASAPERSQAVVVLIYNEELLPSRTVVLEILEIEQEVFKKYRETLIIHPISQGIVFGDKRKSNWELSRIGILMPKLKSDCRHGAVFSNQTQGSATATKILTGSELVPIGSYNTQMIDTRYVYDGELYYISLRTMSVGTQLISAYPRARLVGEGSASVHSGDTPKNAQLLNHLYSHFIVNNISELNRICKLVGSYAGPSFISLDILPCVHSKLLYVCEVGFKMDDFTYRERFSSIISQLDFASDVDGSNIVRSAHVLASEVRLAGFWA